MVRPGRLTVVRTPPFTPPRTRRASMTLQQLGVAVANATDDAVATALAGDTRKLKLVSKSKPVLARRCDLGPLRG